jgi:hypothetical protein
MALWLQINNRNVMGGGNSTLTRPAFIDRVEHRLRGRTGQGADGRWGTGWIEWGFNHERA